MNYYKVQFAPFRYFIKNYLCYNDDKGFYLWHSGSAMYFSEEQINNDNDLIYFLKNRRYRLILVDNQTILYKYKTYKN